MRRDPGPCGARSLGGHKFVRQEPIGRYVVDFVCREARLVIEVDGGQHATDTRDAARDQWLAEHRYRVLRFWNNDVLQNMDGVLEAIALGLGRKRGSGRAQEELLSPGSLTQYVLGVPRAPTSPRLRGEVDRRASPCDAMAGG